MNSRNEILNRLRQSVQAGKKNLGFALSDKALFADYPESANYLVDIFRRQFLNLYGEFHYLESKKAVADLLFERIKDIEPEKCKAHHFPLFKELKMTNSSLNNIFKKELEKETSSFDFANYEVGITGADALIARTGSVMLRTTSAGGRRLSVLPPIHIILAEDDQLVFSLEQALQKLYEGETCWSYATIISGPSRTSDIEKELVLGAHGPKRLIVLLLKS